jgi:hypothetical protein
VPLSGLAINDLTPEVECLEMEGSSFSHLPAMNSFSKASGRLLNLDVHCSVDLQGYSSLKTKEAMKLDGEKVRR